MEFMEKTRFLKWLHPMLESLCWWSQPIDGAKGVPRTEDRYGQDAMQAAFQDLVARSEGAVLRLQDFDFFHKWDFVMTPAQRTTTLAMEKSIYERVGSNSAKMLAEVASDEAQSAVGGSALVALLKANAEINKKKRKKSLMPAYTLPSSASSSSRAPLPLPGGADDPDEDLFEEEMPVIMQGGEMEDSMDIS